MPERDSALESIRNDVIAGLILAFILAVIGLIGASLGIGAPAGPTSAVITPTTPDFTQTSTQTPFPILTEVGPSATNLIPALTPISAPTFTQDIKDDDQDGILNRNDFCQYQPGSAANNGCPIDSDGDGSLDDNDHCVSQAGPIENSGCPIPGTAFDTDEDGISDSRDQCPSAAGVAANNGCPIADADGDGVPNTTDQCPSVAGTLSNGCSS